MFLAIRELQHSRLRYLLLGAIITLIAWLVFILSGLANGLATDNAGAIQRMPADYFVFQPDARTQISRSLLPLATVEQVRLVPGIADATPLGQMMLSIKRATGGEQLDAAMLGIEPGSFVTPKIAAGRTLDGQVENGVIVDQKLVDKGVALGDILVVQPSGEQLTVLGFTAGQTYSHAPVIFAALPQWQKLRFAARGAAGQIENPISVVAVRATADTARQIPGAVPGTEVASRAATVSKLPGYSDESGSLLMIQGFLFVIAALILAVFFYVITLQKTAQFGILKAIGARTGFLARDLVGQVFILTIGGIAAGALLTFGIGAAVPVSVPFALDPRLVLAYGAVLLGVSLAGTLLSLRRIATIDPLIAIGRND
jgi:putative ABC transport system permease protein